MEHSIESVTVNTLLDSIEHVIRGKRSEINLVLTCLIAGGHILLEDNPGTGKTVLAKTLAAAISNPSDGFKRVQFTPDLLPMDLLGTHVFNEASKQFDFRKGPLFTHVLLADEINRASPKVQSALLECMAEQQITMGEFTYPLSDVFFVIATQNPIEMEGTYPLPAAQLDRFFMKIHFGYVDEATEWDILRNYRAIGEQSKAMQQVVSLTQLRAWRMEAEKVFIHESILKAVLQLIRKTREQEGIVLGASTRASISLVKCLKAFAFIHARNYVIESDVESIAGSVLYHRLIFKNKSTSNQLLQSMIQDTLKALAKIDPRVD
jgi:MoxR-like ATPase